MRSLTRGLVGRTTPATSLFPVLALAAASAPLQHQQRFQVNMSEAEMAAQREHLEKLKQQQHTQVGAGAGERSSPSRAPSSVDGELQTPEEREQLWLRGMEAKYGEGTYQLFRPLYKDLCDEMRREYYTKPPPPFPVGGRVAPSSSSSSSPTPSPPCGADAVGWQVVYQPANNCVVFRRDAVESLRQGRVVAYSKVAIGDPPKLNALLTFADWCPIEVMIERKGVIVHFSVACNEGGMHMRNVRVYRSPVAGKAEDDKAEEEAEPSAAAATDRGARQTSDLSSSSPSEGETGKAFRRDRSTKTPRQLQQHPTPANILDATDDAEWCRQNLCYDGPCLWHLELDFQNELYDVMQDHGITLDWIRWAAEWVHYLEHVNYARWSVGMLEELVPSGRRGPESDFLTDGEREALDEPAEDWLSARAI